MTVVVSQRSAQSADGGGITVQAFLTAGVGDSPHRLVLGVTTTATPPVVFTDFTHVDNQANELTLGTFWDQQIEDFHILLAVGNIGQESDRYNLQKYVRLDSNYVAGRYLWVAAWNTNSTPAGADAWNAVSSSYLIR